MALAYNPGTLPKPLKDRWPNWADGRERRANARRKLDLYGEQHLVHVRKLIAARVDDESLAEVLTFAGRAPNLVRGVVDAVAVCYRQGCQRELRVGEIAAKVFAEVVSESGIDRRAAGFNAMAWLLGPTIVAPYLEPRGRVALDVITADRSDVKRTGDYIEAVIWRRDDGVIIELDGEAWRYFGSDGKELVPAVPHYVGHCPAVPFRADEALDWWAAHEHMGLADASLDIAYKLALGLWTRQVSANQLTVVQGDIEGISPGQTINSPSKPLVLGPTSAGYSVTVLDRSIDPGPYLAEMQAIAALAVARYGLAPSDVVFQAVSADAFASQGITVRGERLAGLRDKQVPWLRHAEHELWPIVCDLLRGSVHRHARVLPPGDEVRDALRVTFPDLASPVERKARVEALELEVKFGLSSPVDLLLASRPELTRAEAEEEIDANRQAEIERTALLAARNQPALGKVPESLAQLQGRVGGQASGEARRQENDQQP